MYENADKQELILSMEEACLLPENDPKRQEIEEKIHSLEWAKQEWQMLLQEADIVHENLSKVRCPIHLTQKLLAMPQKHPVKAPLYRYLSWGIAAIVATVFIVGLIFYTPKQQHTFKNIAMASIKWHSSPLSLDLETSDRQKLHDFFVENAYISPNWTKVDERFSLRGGKVISLDNKPILYSLWQTSVGNCTLVQFKARDFNINENVKKEFWDKNTLSLSEDYNFLCMVWIKNGDAHVWVINDGEKQRDFFNK